MGEGVRRLILFDVDGTLITSGGRAGQALTAALEATFSRAVSYDGYRYSGKTDPQIVFELMQHTGVARDQVAPRLEEVFRRYLHNLEEALQPGTVTVLPGVRELLDALAPNGKAAVGLLTGNIEAGAHVKLGVAGLGHYFRVGAFGSDREDRNALVPVARARARQLWGEEFPGALTVVVGDAEADVLCARAAGARAVAVTTGWTSRAQLAALGPDALLDSLSPPAALRAVLDATG